jgi:branched-chain amino acid aminotransferase
LTSAYLRPLIFRGIGTIAVDPRENSTIDVVVGAFEMGAYLGTDSREKGIDACVSSWHRTNSSTNPVLAKAGGHYLNAYLIGSEARRNGFGEGISVSATGLVAEGAAENLFLVRGGKLYTPPLSAAILGGITRDSVITLARQRGYEVIEEALPRELLYTCDELFMTGTAAEVTPIRSVDRLPVGSGEPGPITRSIQQAFFGLFSGDTPDEWGWLDYVAQPAATTR